MPIGMTFAPTNHTTDERRGPTTPPIQEAIRLLSLQLPRVTGASAPTPTALLAGSGGGRFGGSTSNPIIEQLLRAIFGGRSPMAGPLPGLPAPGLPSMPSRPVFPSFTMGAPMPRLPEAPPMPGPSAAPEPPSPGHFEPTEPAYSAFDFQG